jgi:hypothetical protein
VDIEGGRERQPAITNHSNSLCWPARPGPPSAEHRTRHHVYWKHTLCCQRPNSPGTSCHRICGSISSTYVRWCVRLHVCLQACKRYLFRALLPCGRSCDHEHCQGHGISRVVCNCIRMRRRQATNNYTSCCVCGNPIVSPYPSAG